MLLLLVFISALTAARADCDACVQGICHFKQTLLQGFHVPHRQLAIDRTNNILYVHINYYTVAFFIDENKMLNVNAKSNNDESGIAVDQETQVLYLGGYSCKCIYAYTREQNVYTKKLAAYLDYKLPFRLHYEDTLYTINDRGSCGYLNKTTNSFIGYSNLENFEVSDMVIVRNATEWFFSSSNKLYKFSWDSKGKKAWELISDKRHVLSIGKYGDVYFADDSIKVIYRLDRDTKELKEYAAYTNVSVVDFVFDRDEHIVFLDYNDTVSRWVPNGEPCTAPHQIWSGDVKSHRVGNIHKNTQGNAVDNIHGTFLVDLVQRGVTENNVTSLTTDSNDIYEVIRT